MGGVKTSLNGETDLKGLYAAGEVACTGVHGANRLASNSLLEGLVYGARTGRAALESSVAPGTCAALPQKTSSITECDEIRRALRKLMWERAGIIRCGESLGEAREKLLMWEGIIEKKYATRNELELKNMITVARIIVKAALAREGSVGAHYRSDRKDRGKNWQQHIRWNKQTFDFKSGAADHAGKAKAGICSI
jgi:L-aspartate oxidase